MLIGDKEEAVVQIVSAPLRGSKVTSSLAKSPDDSSRIQTRLARVLRIEWLGQTIASVCWIGSVVAYGINSSGDWLQLLAASSWLLANVAAVVTIKAD